MKPANGLGKVVSLGVTVGRRGGVSQGEKISCLTRKYGVCVCVCVFEQVDTERLLLDPQPLRAEARSL